MNKVADVLFSLIRYEVFGAEYTRDLNELDDGALVAAVSSLAAFHDMAHLVADALARLSVIPADEKLANALGREHLKAIFRAERMDGELTALCGLFEKEKIEFLPLKGAVIRELYPEKWMRTSCDVDILVHKEDLERASDALCSELGYTREETGEHDIGFVSGSGIRLELHFALNDEGAGLEIFENIWEHTFAKEEGGFCRYLSDGMFYLYHVYHMAKHVENGGCGIKPLLDLKFIPEVGGELLKANGLERFADAAQKLSRVWFDGFERDALASELENYILRAGVYGNVSNAVAVGQIKHGGRFKYILFKIFLPYKRLKYQYPVLQKHKWLMPVCWVRRWLRILFKGGVKRSVNEVKVNAGMKSEYSESVEELFLKLGIKR